MKINSVAVGLIRTNCYVVQGSYNNEDYVMVIDPGESFDKIKEIIPGPVTHIVLTHAHFDHIGALPDIRKEYPQAKLYIGEKEEYSKQHLEEVIRKVLGRYAEVTHFMKRGIVEVKPDFLLKDGDEILNFKVMHTPGHTAGSICLYCKDENVLFSGDTVFAYTYGRFDIDGNEEDMMASIKKIMALDDKTVIYPGHDEISTIENTRKYLT